MTGRPAHQLLDVPAFGRILLILGLDPDHHGAMSECARWIPMRPDHGLDDRGQIMIEVMLPDPQDAPAVLKQAPGLQAVTCGVGPELLIPEV